MKNVPTCKFKYYVWPGNMTQWVKELDIKTDKFNLAPRIHMAKSEFTLPTS